MPHFLFQAAYSTDAWASMVKSPQDRIEAIRPVVEKLGGKVVAGYLVLLQLRAGDFRMDGL